MVADLDESGLWAGRQCLDGGSLNQAVAILAMLKGSSSPNWRLRCAGQLIENVAQPV